MMLNKPVLSLDQVIGQLNSGTKWQSSTVKFSFATHIPIGGFPGNESSGISVFTAAQMTATRSIMQLWSDLIGIDIVESNESQGDILFTNYASAGQAYAYFPTAGDIFINNESPSNFELGDGQYGYMTLIHEVGHALGLDHPGAYDSTNGNVLDYESQAEYQQDSRQNTLMSYWDAQNTNANHGFDNYGSTPLLHDIAAIQAIYGASTTTRTEDTTYGFNSNADRSVYQFSGHGATPIIAIWDSAGNDTLDFSGYTQNAYISLVAGSFSNVGGLTKNVAIAYGAHIENAVGGSGNDTIIGQESDNWLRGSAGNDVIQGAFGNDFLDGGSGDDTAVFSGKLDQYTAKNLASGRYQISGTDGIDIITNIEYIQFSDAVLLPLPQTIQILLNKSVSDDNNSFSTAANLNVGQVFNTNIGASDSIDFFKINAASNGELAINLSGLGGSFTLSVYDSSSTLLKMGIMGDSSIKTFVNKGSEYYIIISTQETDVFDYEITSSVQVATSQSTVLSLIVGMFNAAPGAFYLNSFAEILNNGTSIDELATSLGNSDVFTGIYSNSLSNSEFSTAFIDRVLGNETSIIDKNLASNWVLNELNNGVTKASVMQAISLTLTNLSTTDPQWGAAHSAFVNKVAVAQWYSIDQGKSAFELSTLQNVIASVTSDINSVTNIVGDAFQLPQILSMKEVNVPEKRSMYISKNEENNILKISANQVFNKEKITVELVSDVAEYDDLLNFASSGDGSTEGIISWFQFAENTYIVDDCAAQTSFSEQHDTVIKLSGLLDLSQSYLTDQGLVLV